MKFIIFGTGDFRKAFIGFFSNETILCYIDNNKSKQGTFIDGVEVLAPEQVDYSEADYVVIMVLHSEGMKNQLLDLGVPQNKIVSYTDIPNVLGLDLEVQVGNDVVDTRKWLDNCEGKKCFVLVHDYSLNGVPVVNMHLSKVLMQMGFNVLYGSLKDGDLTHDLELEKVPYVKNLGVWIDDKRLKELVSEFDMVVLGTIAVAEFKKVLCDYSKPIVWWINESYDVLFKDNDLGDQKKNEYYFADSRPIEETFHRFYKERFIDRLSYFVPENVCKKYTMSTDGRVRFGVFGTVCERKGQDVVIDALRLLPESILNEISIIFVGEQYDDIQIDWKSVEKEFPGVTYKKAIPQEEFNNLYGAIDVLLCPSREDSAPVVVSQAFMNYLPCIVSTGVGQSDYMKDDYAGYTFENVNPSSLANVIRKCVENKELLQEKGRQGRKIFEDVFSENAFKKTLETKIISLMS